MCPLKRAHVQRWNSKETAPDPHLRCNRPSDSRGKRVSLIARGWFVLIFVLCFTMQKRYAYLVSVLTFKIVRVHRYYMYLTLAITNANFFLQSMAFGLDYLIMSVHGLLFIYSHRFPIRIFPYAIKLHYSAMYPCLSSSSTPGWHDIFQLSSSHSMSEECGLSSPDKDTQLSVLISLIRGILITPFTYMNRRNIHVMFMLSTNLNCQNMH